MRRVAPAALFLLACPVAFAQFHHHAISGLGRGSPCLKHFAPAELKDDLQKVTWPVYGGDRNEQEKKAQQFFRQGMTEYYGFDYEEAMRNFRMARALSPDMAMASWGIALAAGPNINLGMDPGCREVASREITHAAEQAKELNLPPVEVGLIHALALRYAGPLTETVAYDVAMRNLWETVTKQDSSNAANVANVGALYAESLIEMRPWALYNVASEAALDTRIVDDVLEAAMKAQPGTIGANHFYIHAVEASIDPDRGTDSADVLRKANSGAGHLVHMPSHIYFLNGEYAAAMQSNTDAAKTDNDAYRIPCLGNFREYSKNENCPQLYYGHYLSHNLFFRGVAAAFNGQSKDAVTSACETRAHVQRFVANEPGLQRYMTAPLMMLVMNRSWEKILDEPKPPTRCYMAPFVPPVYPRNGCHILTAMWYWAKGMAHAANGALDLASNDYEQMAAQARQIEPPTPTGWGNNSADAVLAVAQSMLQARYTWAGGQCQTGVCWPVKKQSWDKVCGQCNAVECSEGQPGCIQATEQAIEHLKLAVTHEDALAYDEPPQWFPPAREALGGAYLRVAEGLVNDPDKRNKTYKLAEETFDKDLDFHKKSGRALYGKLRALMGQTPVDTKKVTDATTAFCTAWNHADYTMTENDLWPASAGGGAEKDSVTCGKVVRAPDSNACLRP